MSTYSLGALSGTIISRNGYSVTTSDSTDVFGFSLNSSRNINLFLHNISAGDDADLRLYRDNNSNGILDAADVFLTSSTNDGNATESINYSGSSGNYLVQVSRYAPGSSGSVNYDLDLSSVYNVGSLNSSPKSRDNYGLSASDPTDVFKFSISGTQNINLNLHNISAGDDADLQLYRDINNNGVWDANDQAAGSVASSSKGGNADDSINYRGGSGTYFARVNRYAAGSSGSVSYNLDFSATATSSPSNLLSREVQVGTLNSDRTYSGAVGNSDTSDLYYFNLPTFAGVNLRLNGLTADADIRLIRDSNNDRIVQAGEVIGTSTNGGNVSELISGIEQSGNYYLQVYQYTGNANYQLTLDRYTTPYA